MAFSRVTAILLLASLMVSAIIPTSLAGNKYLAINYYKEPKKPNPPCTECYGNCTQEWRPHTCHFKCWWCLPLNQTISGQPPTTGMQSFIQGTRSSVGFVVDTFSAGVNGIKSLLHIVF